MTTRRERRLKPRYTSSISATQQIASKTHKKQLLITSCNHTNKVKCIKQFQQMTTLRKVSRSLPTVVIVSPSFCSVSIIFHDDVSTISCRAPVGKLPTHSVCLRNFNNFHQLWGDSSYVLLLCVHICIMDQQILLTPGSHTHQQERVNLTAFSFRPIFFVKPYDFNRLNRARVNQDLHSLFLLTCKLWNSLSSSVFHFQQLTSSGRKHEDI